jgi:16S rRNA (cytosine967-C5)-methyltransferase
MSGRKKNKTSRHIAVLCLVSWNKDRQAVQLHIESKVYGSPLVSSDRHLAVMLVQGVLRQLEYLDSIIGKFSKHPLKKMKPLTLMTLRVGVFQLLFLDRIPDSAAVNETVKVMKAEGQPSWMVNFANGVLRNISRKKSLLPGSDQAGENGKAVLNHPPWLWQRWQDRYGFEKAEEICHRNNQEPFLVLRVNTLLTKTENLAELLRKAEIEVHKSKYAVDALVVTSPAGPVSAMPGYEEGLFHIQDEAAQLVTLLLGPFDEIKSYLDACAGLGGKTCQLAQMMPAGAKLLAVEPSGHRFQLLQENLQRLGLEKKVQSFKGHLSTLMEKGSELFHAILVDAPCSGTGVIRRHPDIRWNRCLQDLQSYQQQQLEILQQAASLLLPGGVLVYATCSMEPEENEQVVDLFLTRNSGFSISDAARFLPNSAAILVSPAGYFSTTPAEGVDGFFGVRFVRVAK